MAAGILRCVLIVTAGANGASQAGSWACRETFVAVVIGNAPMIYPLFRRAARRAGWYISSRGHSQSYPAYPLSEGERGENSTHHSKKRRFRHPLSIPDTHWHTINDEAMILPTSRQQPPTCTASPPRDWDALSQPSADGIKVVHEMIIERNER
ncbi:hypothetical protein ACP6JE_007721 [Aspergillus fumigatus]